MEIRIVKNYEELSKVAAQEVASVIKHEENPVLGLATGSTPIGLYQELISMYQQGQIDFSKTSSVNLDEYIGLDGTHDQSYRYFMNDKLFNHINIDKNRTFVPNGMAEDPAKAADEYEALVEELGPIDVQILGIGANGHIGFNEPANKLSLTTHVTGLTDSTISANARFFESIKDVPTQAITMGLGQILKAKKIILLASGLGKAEIMKGVTNQYISTHVPASILKVHPNVVVIMDEDAASLLPKE